MFTRVTGKSIFILFVYLLYSNYILQAQEVIFSTEVNTSKIGLDDDLEVTYSIKNAGNVSRFIPSSFDGFTVIAGPMQSNSVNIINGNMSSATNITYVLKPIKTGNIIVPGAKAIAEGNTIKSNAVTVTVVKGTVAASKNSKRSSKQIINPFDDESFPNPFDDPFFKRFFNRNGSSPQPNTQPYKKQNLPPSTNFTQADIEKKIFAKIDVSKSDIYLGEPIIVTYNVYSQIPLSIQPLMPTGSPKGFWVKDVALDPNAYKERKQINGKEYVVIPVRKFAVIPTQSGNLMLDSFVVEGVAEIATADNNGISSFFDDMFNSGHSGQIPFAAEGENIYIHVKPLPEKNKPADFSGAVGHFNFEANIDKTELSTDQTLSVNYTIKGNGNITMMGAPRVTFPEAFQSFEPKMFDTITQVNTTLNGYKNYNYILTPRQTGNIAIPQASFSYFDLETNDYKTIVSPSYNIKIKPGSNFDNMVADNKLNDIHDIESSDPMRINFSQPLIEKSLYWVLLGLPFITIGGIYFFKKQNRNNKAISKDKNINKSAQRIAKSRLELAEKFLIQKDYTNFYTSTSKAIWLYLSDKLNIPLARLSKEIVEQRFQSLQVESEIQQSIFSIIQTCETALYANINDPENSANIFKLAIENISKLEEKLA